ncbi:MAG TPA: PapC/FimD family outer membrane usher protein [Pantoea sp.]|nr:PapC/FimD family outer membrane usher protein [Pantoea sp.]
MLNKYPGINGKQTSRVVRPLVLAISLALFTAYPSLAKEVEFNLDNLDVSDRENIDMTQFARAGFIMPGQYDMVVRVNKSDLPAMPITFLPPDDDPKESVACISPELMQQLGLKPRSLEKVSYWHLGQCANLTDLPGTTARGELANSVLTISVPQAYLEYQATDWDPPSRWDDGIPGVLFDYNVNLNYSTAQQVSETSSTSASGNGVAGANLGPWRMRANWQGQYNRNESGSTHQLTWSQYYAYRAIKAWRAKLLLGQNYLTTDMFDSVRFVGVSVISDDSQLPPNLRGYAPEVGGVAKTNAKVTISQLGRVIYESQVAPGPFLIQDLSEATSGTLDVRVEEQDGSVQQFQVETATIPYLSRPGQVRYKISAGQPADQQFKPHGTLMQTGEFSWGVSNGWSLLGGMVAAGKYNAYSLGVGRDLLALGAISLSATQSHVELPKSGKQVGSSYSLSYSKRFEEYDTQVTFAGYRFSQRNYMTISRYLDELKYGEHSYQRGDDKQTYSVTLNKQFRSLGLSAFLNYYYQTYWDRPATSRWNMSLARYFDVGSIKNMSVNLSAYRNELRGKTDDTLYLSFNIPLGGAASINYSAQSGSSGATQNVGWYQRLDERNTYQVSAITSSDEAPTLSGYYSRTGDIAQVNTSASYKAGVYHSAGLSAQGGVTATTQGAALHRTNFAGGTRLMVDTEGVSDVPIQGGGSAATHTNLFGKAVITDVNSYYRNQASIDIKNLPENVEAERSITQVTLTEGAIGYRKFGVITGQKLMAVIRRADGSFPPFGASVLNDGRETGIVSDSGSVWLSGVNPGVKMAVRWSGATQCIITLPDVLPEDPSGENNLLLPCIDSVE